MEKAIWNWMDTYPHEFKELQRGRAPNEDLSRYCDSFFDTLDNFAETKNKHRSVIWPLQLMLLILTPKVNSRSARNYSGPIDNLLNFRFWRRSTTPTRARPARPNT
jgi:hypothetical protein